MRPRLGPFELHAPLGHGGMGEVWRATHTRSGLPIAIKVLTSEAAREPATHAALRAEIRAIATLDHPAIVRIFDSGTIPNPSPSEGLPPGSPWLAMELATGGPLDLDAPRSWSALRRLLMTLLDALAHAHARGVIHRDLKAANLVVCTDADARPGIKLTDFGIAWLTGSTNPDTSGASAGTIHSMAPEQIRGDTAVFGPWTDMYAVGCLAWRLATGKRIFHERSSVHLLMGHVADDPGPFAPVLRVPPGFEAWVRALLRKAPHARFQRAADAAWALPDGPDGEATARGPMREELPTALILPASELPTRIRTRKDRRAQVLGPIGDLPTVLRAPRSVAAPSGAATETASPGLSVPPPAAPLPTRWETPPAPNPNPRLIGAGIGIVGLRRAPLVGRAQERETAWQALRDTARTERPHLLTIRGPAGIGRTALGRWLCERADELGAASTLRVVDPTRPRLMAATVASLLSLGLADPLDVRSALGRLTLDPDDVEALVSALDGDTWPTEAFLRLLGQVSGQRPVLWWIDDAERALPLLRVVHEALARDLRCRLVVVLGVREDLLGEHPEEAALLDRLEARGTALPLAPLAAGEIAELAHGLLAMDEVTAAVLFDRSRGNPLHAVQLLEDWVRRELLALGPDGFALPPGAPLTLPDDLYAVWRRRAEALTAGQPEAARGWLEAAAILGREVSRAAWEAVCGDDARAARDRLVERLLDARLVVSRSDGFAFAHGPFREALLQVASEAGRHVDHHLRCAASHPGDGLPDVLVRGRHLHAAGRPLEAVAPLASAAVLLRRSGRVRDSLAVAHEAEATLEACRDAKGFLPPEIPAWMPAQLLAIRADGLRYLGRTDEGISIAEAAVARARPLPPSGQKGGILGVLASLYMERDRADATTEALWREALDCFEAVGSPLHVSAAHFDLCRVKRTQGRLEDAQAHAEACEAAALASGNAGSIVRALGLRGELALSEGNIEEAILRLGRAVEAARSAGLDDALGSSLYLLGWAELRRGRLEPAEAYTREALPLLRALETPRADSAALQLGRILMRAGKEGEALEHMARLLHSGRVATLPHLTLFAELQMAVLQARAGVWEEVRRGLTRALQAPITVNRMPWSEIDDAEELVARTHAAGMPDLTALASQVRARWA